MDTLRVINAGVLAIALVAAWTVAAFVTQPLLPFGAEYPRENVASDPEALERYVRTLSDFDRESATGKTLTAEYLMAELGKAGVGKGSGTSLRRQEFRVDGETFSNVIASFSWAAESGTPKRRIIVGAHYDTDGKIAGADDNASGVAGLLEAARVLAAKAPLAGRDVELVFYANEEMPSFGTDDMGSYAHAASLADPGSVDLALVLEMIGYFSEEKDSQDFPIRGMRYLYPTTGNFIALVSNPDGSGPIRRAKRIFRSVLDDRGLIGAYSVNAPESVPGVDFSDHRNYWRFGIPAIMVTDTAFYRNRFYHTAQDTPEKLDYTKMAEVVDAVVATALHY